MSIKVKKIVLFFSGFVGLGIVICIVLIIKYGALGPKIYCIENSCVTFQKGLWIPLSKPKEFFKPNYIEQAFVNINQIYYLRLTLWKENQDFLEKLHGRYAKIDSLINGNSLIVILKISDKEYCISSGDYMIDAVIEKNIGKLTVKEVRDIYSGLKISRK